MKSLRLYPFPRRVEYTGGKVDSIPEIHWECVRDCSEEYVLILGSDSVRIQASPQGYQRALSTVYQLRHIILLEGSLPCLVIKDGPDLAVRGFMLDISRGRVPNQAELKRLVHQLWLLKFNQLQLYTEHTFRYPGHEKVWNGTGAMDSQTILWLDQWCGSHGIELVPNQNTFGHMEHWLKYPDYHYIAESPNGYEHPVLGWRTSGGVLQPGGESLAFAQQLLGLLLPHFRSPQVNIGCDETWELGQGASRKKAEELGVEALFLQHLKGLINMARDYGKQPQFWADIFLKTKAEDWHGLENTLPIIWGYEPGHPFDPALDQLQRAGLPGLLAPGTSAWNSFGGRWTCSRENIKEAVEACRNRAAKGILLTSWGDNGHAYPACVMWPALALTAGLSWSGNDNEARLEWGLCLLNGRPDPGAFKALLELGDLDAQVGTTTPNMSGIYRSALGIELKGIPNPYNPYSQQTDAALEVLETVRKALREQPSESFNSDHSAARGGIQLATDLTEWALFASSGRNLPQELYSIGNRFDADWNRSAQSPVPAMWECLPRTVEGSP